MSIDGIANTNQGNPVQTVRKARSFGARRWWAVAIVAVAVGALSLSVARAQEFGGFGGGGGGFMKARMERLLSAAGASDAQKTQIHAIWQGLRPQLKPLHQQAATLRRQIGETIAAPTVDVARVEQLRKQSMETMDKISAVMTQGMVVSAQILTPEQRKTVLARIQEHRRHDAGAEAGE